MASILDELCEGCGIALEYQDVWGKIQHPSESTKLALLNAIGVPLVAPEQASSSAAQLAEERWRQVLPCVRVAREHEPETALTVSLPDSHPELVWFFQAETGERMQGELAATSLCRLESRDISGLRYTRYRWELPVRPGLGYHTLGLAQSEGPQQVVARTRLIVCPEKCHSPAELENGGRLWGPALQLYAVRSDRNWGMGDFSDLKRLVAIAAGGAAGFIGLNPLHALDPRRAAEASPYSPSSRTALNVLYLDVESIPDFGESQAAQRLVSAPDFQETLARLRESELVDYPGVARAKSVVLEFLYAHFREHHLTRSTSRAHSFRSFQAAGGEHLRLHSLFEALQEHFAAADPLAWGWPAWPEPYRDARGEAVAAFSRLHLQRVEYFQYLQWQADVQLAEAHEHARAFGLPVGFYQDLAVGARAGGAETWSYPALYAGTASIGAPPDEFNLRGQDWGIAPPIPRALEEAGYEPFIAMLRAAMRHAGALRIDHIMGLMRLYWIPRNAEPSQGAYVAYAFDDLLGILALESRRNRCLIIGEDLGTVPDRVRAAMESLAILSYRPLYFQRDEGGEFKQPDRYPRDALVTVSTHDLPTLKGFWRGTDLAARQALGLFPDEQMRERMMMERAEDRVRLVLALERAGLEAPDKSVNDFVARDLDESAVRAVHEFLARSPAKLFSIQMEDVFGQVEQVNLPATSGDSYPNWRRKLPVTLEDWQQDERFSAMAAMLRQERGRPGTAAEARSDRRRPSRVIPRATYRLQFNRDFTFRKALKVVPYLATLGISHVYASSYLKARPGSPHGYDIVDHNAFNPEIGSEREFEEFVAALGRHGMNHMLDLVPNHMGVLESDNAWWLDVLENGPASVHSGYFDIDWDAADEELRGKVLIPVLGEQYGAALEEGKLRLSFDERCGEFSLLYHRHRFPIDPREYPRILGMGVERLAARTGPEAGFTEFASLLTALGHLPARDEIAPDKVAERARDKEVRKRELASLCRQSNEVADFIARNVEILNGRPGEAASFDALHQLIEAQAFRLAHWRVASDDINYRRFFEINDLAALRMESEAVFEDTHRLVLRLIGAGAIEALRIDHPDGLNDPKRYLERLQAACARQFAARETAEGSGAPGKCVYVAIEKILASHERLPEDWPVDGTTGYRFATVVNGLLVDTAAETEIDRAYSHFIGTHYDYAELVRQSKRLVMSSSLASELNRLARLLKRIAGSDRRNRDFTFNSLRRALMEIVASFPVYRTYIDSAGVREEDIRYIDWAIGLARRRAYAGDTSVYDFIRAVLTGAAGTGAEGYSACRASFIARFQQFTAPVMAKASEDTAFYIYNRLVSLNEVGGDPATFGLSLSAFHAASADRAKNWPHTMLATSTHDNKRSEDVRSRIDVISEDPSAWRRAIGRWARINRQKKMDLPSGPAPSRNDEYLLYQTLLGAWPLEAMDQNSLAPFRERIQRYMHKAVREAKVNTSWLNPDEEYERALASFIDALLKSLEGNLFLSDFLRFEERLAHYGLLNSLSQTAIKITSPGVPDIYQGNELWDFSLVDPDNRRPVDYARRAALLEELVSSFACPPTQWREKAMALLREMHDGRVKLYVTWRLLELRRRRAELFEQGGYTALQASGSRAPHVCAFAREHASGMSISVAPRLMARLSGEARLPLGEAIWSDTRIPVPPAKTFQNELTGERLEVEHSEGQPVLRLAAVLSAFPVAVLVALN